MTELASYGERLQNFFHIIQSMVTVKYYSHAQVFNSKYDKTKAHPNTERLYEGSPPQSNTTITVCVLMSPSSFIKASLTDVQYLIFIFKIGQEDKKQTIISVQLLNKRTEQPAALLLISSIRNLELMKKKKSFN